MSIEAAIAAVHAAGYHVRNLFERQAGGWQANIGTLKGTTYSDFGIAATPDGALLASLKGAPPIEPAPEPSQLEVGVKLLPPGTVRKPSLFD